MEVRHLRSFPTAFDFTTLLLCHPNFGIPLIGSMAQSMYS